MKLRIKGNSIRLRLGQSEVRRLAIEGTIEETTVFGHSKEECFGYAVVASPELEYVSASYSCRRIVIRIPTAVIHRWAESDEVSIRAVQRTTGENDLLILIEKDFECIDAPSDESQEDAFPHPRLDDGCAPTTTGVRKNLHNE